MDANNGTRATQLSGLYRYLAGWQPATPVTQNLRRRSLAPFRSWDDMGDLLLLAIDEQPPDPLCPLYPRTESFLVENWQGSSYWTDPANYWDQPGHAAPCGGPGTGFPKRNTLVGNGLQIYHLFQAGRGNLVVNSAQMPSEWILKYADVEAATGLFDTDSVPGFGVRVIQDQKPLPYGPGGWDRLDALVGLGSGMGEWGARQLWNSSDSTGSCFAPYTNPGSGEYSPKSCLMPPPPECPPCCPPACLGPTPCLAPSRVL